MCDRIKLDLIRTKSVIQGNFDSCIINKTQDFFNKRFSKSSFNKAKFTDVNCKSATFDEVEFKKTFFTKVNLSDVVLQECDFEGAVLKSVDFTGSSFIDVKMKNVFLTTVNFTDVSTANTIEFHYANIKDTNFTNAGLTGIVFFDSDFYNTNFNKSYLPVAEFESSRFYECNFEDANFKEVMFYDVKITNSNLSNANFTKANIKETDFTGADFTGVNFTDAKILKTIFTGAKMTNAQFKNADLDGVDFTGADLTNADFTGAVWKNTVFPDVKLSPTFKRILHKQNALIKEGHVIKGDVDMMKYLNENNNSVAFLFQGNYHLIDKNELSNKIQTNSENTKKNNSIVYECKEPQLEPVLHKPLMKFGSIYIDIEYIKRVIENKGEDRIYEIVETADKVKYVISYQVLHKLTDNVYSSHCQEGQGGKIYKLQKIQKMQTSKKITFLNSDHKELQKAGKMKRDFINKNIRNKTSRLKTKKKSSNQYTRNRMVLKKGPTRYSRRCME